MIKNVLVTICLLSFLGCQDSETISLKEYVYDSNNRGNILHYTTVRLKKSSNFNSFDSFVYYYDTTYNYTSQEFITEYDGFYLTYKKTSDDGKIDKCLVTAVYSDERPDECFSLVDSVIYTVDSMTFTIFKCKRENPPDDGSLDLYWSNEFGVIQTYSNDWGIKVINGEYDKGSWDNIINQLNQLILADTDFYKN